MELQVGPRSGIRSCRFPSRGRLVSSFAQRALAAVVRSAAAVMKPRGEFDQERAMFRRISQHDKGPLLVAFAYSIAVPAVERKRALLSHTNLLHCVPKPCTITI